MQPIAGRLSGDGRWMWDGVRWAPAVSHDGRWLWNGGQWVALATPRRSFWQPRWRPQDSVAVALWLTLVPLALTGVTVAVGLLGRLTAAGALLATVVAYTVWAFVGGAVVRPHGRWWEVVLVAGALVAFLVLVDMVGYLAVGLIGHDQPGDDNGVGVGIAMLVFVVFPPTLLPVALGRLLRRALARSGGPS